jgi:uncharacterized membrane protein YphA (DoxX/SURF4 family)
MDTIETGQPRRKLNFLLWIIQILLALLFIFSGTMKFIMPVAEMTREIPFPGWFLHFIGASEIAGGLGLVLPELLKIRRELTPLAAAGLFIIMIGATVINLKVGPRGAALITAPVGLLLVFVAYSRWRTFPRQSP